jgi:uncharacterized protein (TIGR03435 family)
MIRRASNWLPAIVAGIVVYFAHAQPPAFSFEVASVKVTPLPPPNGRLIATDTDPGMVRYSNVTLRNLIAIAYRFDSRLVRGGQAWLDTEHYEVAAKAPSGTPKERVPLMLQTLLLERFKLAAHREKREQRVYFLAVERHGSKLKEAPPEEDQDPQHVRGDRAPVQILPGRISGHAAPVASLASALALVAGYQVVDHTHLSGVFDFNLSWTPENSNGTGPELFTAIQEQLGLKLESGKDQVEMLVIDHADRIPTDN